jgi:hypothetical protein
MLLLIVIGPGARLPCQKQQSDHNQYRFHELKLISEDK